jgi:hypothetical protein
MARLATVCGLRGRQSRQCYSRQPRRARPCASARCRHCQCRLFRPRLPCRRRRNGCYCPIALARLYSTPTASFVSRCSSRARSMQRQTCRRRHTTGIACLCSPVLICMCTCLSAYLRSRRCRASPRRSLKDNPVLTLIHWTVYKSTVGIKIGIIVAHP